jgi:hypothetical protein
VAAAVAALKSLKIPRVSLEPETDKISVTEGTPDRTDRSWGFGEVRFEYDPDPDEDTKQNPLF